VRNCIILEPIQKHALSRVRRISSIVFKLNLMFECEFHQITLGFRTP
jgi:hypothetical protein